ncbi:MAG: T9SS type A sorting domain-containing protein [Ignavibacteria bacterium]|nr:T9SS type A sorting domain-containing protein [Ignavibacteria bacterium]
MKRIVNFLSLTAAFLMFAGNSVFADGFNSIYTSDGNYVIAAGDQGNIFRSVNGGNTWARYTEANINFKSVFTSGISVWLTADNGNVYKSTTNSVTLTPYTTGVATSINSVYFTDAMTGFVCGNNGVVLKSVNGGISWTPSSTGISTTENFNSISFKDALNGIVVGNHGQAYITANGGTSWTVVNGVTTTVNLTDVKYFPDGAAVTGEYGALFTKYASDPYSSVPTRTNSDIKAVSGISTTEMHVVGGGGFIRNNKSSSLNFLNFEKNPMLANLVDVHFYNSSTGFAVSSLNNAIIRTTDGGASWTLPTGTSVSYSWAAKPGASGNFLGNNMSLHPTDRNTVFIAFGNQVYRSRNKGDTWNTVGNIIPSGNTPHSFFVSPVDTNIWLVATESSPDRIYRTTNYGQSWTIVGPSLNFSNYGQPLEMDQNNPSVFYFAPDNGGFYKSTDDGATFTEISGNFAFRSPCDIIVTWDNPNVIFVADGITGSGQAKIYKSVNAGVNWTLVHTAASSEVPSMCNTVFDNKIIWSTEWSGSNIYFSSNGGDNWVTHHSNSFSGWGSDICREDPSVLITGSWGASATLSVDFGNTWTNISTGLSGHGGGILIPDRGYILCHQGSNVYKLNVTYSVLTGVSENVISSLPSDFSLSQNYPNPFNPSTSIRFNIPKSGNVYLKVYNELGMEVSTLVNSFRNAGSYEVNFDASGMSSGIYFYKLETEGFVSTKKMLLVK